MPDNYQRVAQGVYLEGLAADYARGIVWYSDVIAGGIHGVGRDAKVASFDQERMWTGGIMLNEDGAVLSSGQGGIRWNHPDSGKSGWLIDEIHGEPINGINEMVADGHGGIFCGTVDLDMVIAGQPTRSATLYHLAADGSVRVAADGLGFTNGIMLSPDGKQLFYNDTFDGTYVFDVSPDLGLSNRRLLLKKEDCDGMAMDAEGNLWITGYRSSEIVRMRPDGTLLAPIATPSGGNTQIRFGGPDMRDFWITSVAADAGDTLAVGDAPSEPNSFLYQGRSDNPGLPLGLARFKLS
ncbi:MAG: SMP-30/Gluconolaconase/LRE protein [Novosphingobium sp.]|nr:SMP-30/Gluconolaconase/LRE protein [Novosphingobium sp.]